MRNDEIGLAADDLLQSSDSELDAVLAHELSVARRHDPEHLIVQRAIGGGMPEAIGDKFERDRFIRRGSSWRRRLSDE